MNNLIEVSYTDFFALMDDRMLNLDKLFAKLQIPNIFS